MSKIIWRMVFFLGFMSAVYQVPVKAADLEIVYDRALTLEELESGKCNLRLTGEIKWGDVGKVKATKGYREEAICLNSPGGNYLEGVKLAELFASNGISTVIEHNAECLSACAIAFMGGTYFIEEPEDIASISRRLHVGGKLGFHAPSLIVEENQYSRSSVEKAYGTAIKAISRLLEFTIKRKTVSEHDGLISKRTLDDGRSPRVKAGLIFEAMNVGPKRFFYIDTVDKAGRWGIDLIGVHDWSLTNRDWGRACWNFLSWYKDESAKGGGLPRIDDPSKVFKFEYAGTEHKQGRIPGEKMVRRNFAIFGMTVYNCKIDEFYWKGPKPISYKIDLKVDETNLGTVWMRPWHAYPPDTPIVVLGK